jgi:putative ABC transport system substrate-binding protein
LQCKLAPSPHSAAPSFLLCSRNYTADWRGPEAWGKAMRRREFITVLGGAVAWPLATRAQQAERMRRIGVFEPLAVDNPAERANIDTFVKAMEALGWAVGRNLQIDVRWAGGDPELLRKQVTELVASAPDAILASSNAGLAQLRRATRSLPIVFVLAIDPIGSGDVVSLARPGGNATGFLLFEYSIAGKWLEMLKAIAPGVKRVAVLRDPSGAAGIGQFAAIQALATPFGVELGVVDARDGDDIERAIRILAREPNAGLIVTASVAAAAHRNMIVTLATQYRLPVVSPFRNTVAAGGLISYGPDLMDQYRAGAGYVDRILKGEKPADLPVQAPTKYHLVINLRTAKALGIEVPPSLLARADEVIE